MRPTVSQIMPFPRYLNTPQRLLFWTLDQLIPFGFFMCGFIALIIVLITERGRLFRPSVAAPH